jgi:hypothetical protein
VHLMNQVSAVVHAIHSYYEPRRAHSFTAEASAKQLRSGAHSEEGRPLRFRLRFVQPVHDRCSNSWAIGCHSVERPLVEALPMGTATLRSSRRMVR